MLQGWTGATAKLYRDQGQSPRAATRAAEEMVCTLQGALIVSLSMDSSKPFLRAVKQLGQFSKA